MRSAVAKRILARTTSDTHHKVSKYAALVTRINFLVKQKGWTQKDLANALGKKPSEISKWMKGEHNLTWNTLCKIESELGEDIFYIPKSIGQGKDNKTKVTLTVYRNAPQPAHIDFIPGKKFLYKEKTA